MRAYLVDAAAVAVRTQVEAVPQQRAGPLAVTQAQRTVQRPRQQGAHCPERVQTRLGQGAPGQRERWMPR